MAKKNYQILKIQRKIAKGKLQILCCLIFLFPFVICNCLFGAFDDAGAGARSAAMSNASTALGDDIYSAYYNPAGFAKIKGSELGIDYSRPFMGFDDGSSIANSFIGYAQKIKNICTLSLGWSKFDLSGYFAENTFAFGCGKELEFIPLSVGTKIKLLNRTFNKTAYTENAAALSTDKTLGGVDPVFGDGYSKSCYSFDLGLLYALNRYNSVGLAVSNINQPDIGFKNKDIVFRSIKVGYAYKTEPIVVDVDFIFRNGDNFINSGFEKWMVLDKNNKVALRGGFGIGSREYANASLGVGYKYDRVFQIDYSFKYPLRGVSDFSGSHQISLTMRYGKDTAKSDAEREKNMADEIKKLKSEIENAKKDLQKKDADSQKTNAKILLLEKSLNDAELEREQLQKTINIMKKKTQPVNRLEAEKYYTQALQLYEKQQLSQAMEVLKKALSLEPDNEEMKKTMERIKKEIQLKQ